MAYMTFDVDSSAVEELAYDSDEELLFITFTGGNVYTYFDVPMDIAMSVAGSDSVGVSVNTLIKGTYESAPGVMSARPVAVDRAMANRVLTVLGNAQVAIENELDLANVDDSNLAALRDVESGLSGLRVAFMEAFKSPSV